MQYEGVIPALSLRHAAEIAVATLEGKKAPKETSTRESLLAKARDSIGAMAAKQKDIRGVFAGGTFCYEAQLALLAAGLSCESNAPVRGATELRSRQQGTGHSLVDMGDDEFTQGRPHPMIDPKLRNARLLSEGRDPTTAVLFVLTLFWATRQRRSLRHVIACAGYAAARSRTSAATPFC